MSFFRQHWFDVGFAFGWVVLMTLAIGQPDVVPGLLWLSLATLFFHQFEEYRCPGTFPGMLNRVLFKSSRPDRYPLNMQTAFIINVGIGWGFYLAAALAGISALWLGIATMLVSVGNIIAHVFLFNIRGRTFYNAGMGTALGLFLPLSTGFFYIVVARHLATATDWGAGFALGLLLNYVGIIKMIGWFENLETPYIFSARFLLSKDRRA